MDTEKYNEMQEKIAAGKPVTDEGPYFHHIQWESYKGWGKGKLGGAIIGTIVGGIVGVAAALVLLPTAGIAAAALSAVAFAGAGLWKGMDEFGKIGTVSAAVAAGLDTAERRQQIYIDGKINEIKAELGDDKAKEALKHAKEPAYRTTHYVPPQDESLNRGPVFWKVALVGLVVGMAAGFLLASSPQAVELLGHIVGHETVTALGSTTIKLLSMATFGAFGASFGINRDIFRKIFDQTDLMYRGKVGENVQAKMVTRGKGKDKEQEAENRKDKKDEKAEKAEKSDPQPFMPYNSFIEYPESENHFRDKQLAEAQKKLMSMDHTQMLPN